MEDYKHHSSIDGLTVGLYAALLVLGCMSIYASEYEEGMRLPVYDLSLKSGRQLLWVGISMLMVLAITFTNHRVFESFSYAMYAVLLLLLVAVLFAGKEVSGARSWFSFGGINFQPSELGKYIVLLALAKYLNTPSISPNKLQKQMVMLLLIGLPAGLIVLQGDTGTALVYSSFLIVMYRGGMSPTLILVGAYVLLLFVLVLVVKQLVLIIALVALFLLLLGFMGKNMRRIGLLGACGVLSIVFVLSVEYMMREFLRPYQYKRIQSLVHPEADPLGYGWNVTQSKIAIGAGGLWGKGYLKGTQTQYDFVPEESTDFIFCTIGEEFGWVGSLGLIVLFVGLILRIIALAERQSTRFSLYYGYGVAAVFLFHFTVNLGMTIGIFPVVGIPLPFISYGGSSLLSFTLMLATLLKLDSQRKQGLSRF